MNCRSIIVCVSLLLAAALDGHAAAIAWNMPQNITGDSDVATNGKFLYAEDWGAAATVNGVNFAFDSSATGDANVGISFPATAGRSTTATGTGGTPYSGISTNYKRLVRGLVYGASAAPGATNSGTITLNGLQAGIAYQVQLWVNDSRAAAAGDYTATRSASFGSAGGSSVSLAYYVGGTTSSPAGGLGQYVIGTFLADGATQAITVTASNSTASGTASVQLNAIQVSVLSASGTATVQYSSREQHIDGFGASSAWISSWTVAQADLFFSTNANGVGLSLLRSRIAPDGTTVESSIMQMAQARGATVWSTPWSPPASDKDSGTVNGGDFVSSAANYQSYAAQLAGYVSAMRSSYGVNIYAVSVQNEPDVNQTYESCLWTGQQIDAFVPYLYSALASAGVSSTKIMLPESEAWSFTLASNTMADPSAVGDVGILAGHNYGSVAAAVTQFGTPPPTPLWETEHYFGSDDSIQNGLALAQEIHSFMTVANASAYHYWWLYGSGNGSLAGNSTDAPAKRLYVMGNYSKFVRPGFYRVDAPNTSSALVSAYIDPASANYVIVAANPTQYPILQTFDVSSCPSVASLNNWVTSATLSLASQPAVSVNGGMFTYALPAYTAVTFTAAPAPATLIVLNTSDYYPSSSFSSVGNWDDTNAPNSASNYNIAQNAFRTPSGVSNATFAGNSLTVPLSGLLVLDGPNGQTATFNRLILDGGGVYDDTAGGPGYTLAGQLYIKSSSFINPGANAYQSIAVTAPLSGSGALTFGNGGAGTVSLLANNSAFTGPIIVNTGATLTVNSAASLGANQQLTLDNATFAPSTSFSISNVYSGVTLGPGGGTIALSSGIALTIANPVTGSGALNLTGSGALVLSGVTGGGTVTVSSGATLSGKGAIAGAANVSGALAPVSGSLAFGKTLNFGASAQLQFPVTANTAVPGAAVTAATSASIASGATVNVSLNAAGSSVDFSNAFWGAAQSWPVLTSPSISGAFVLGGVSSDMMGRPASWFGAFSLQQNGTAVNLVWTPAAPWQQWRAVNFGANYSNPAVAGQSVVTAGDGMTNLMKYALGLKAATGYPPGTNIAMGTNANGCLQMTVTKNPAATDLTLTIQATANLANQSSWSSSGVTIDQSTSTLLQAHVTVPMSAAQSGFMRLMVTQP
jgi:glucuronoarabinoxylan endo-1,4-beta-xylanase